MIRIHHMTLKLAAKEEVELLVAPDGKIRGQDMRPGGVAAVGADPKAVLTRILEERAKRNVPGPVPVGPTVTLPPTGRVNPSGSDPKNLPMRTGEGDQVHRAAKTTAVKATRPPGAATGSIVKSDYQKAYRPFDGSCGDGMAEALAGAVRDEQGRVDVKRLAAVAQDNGIDLARWAKLNVGQIRMNLGNVLRSMARKGRNVKVGGRTFTFKPRPPEKTEEK